ncbi:IclR family transcriptional regulator [Microbacterium sp. BR1]|uniref:IclR family transcriptional regulator n=1 Tax=Microbacterium sp. BR1 TaxID=1070896 RepID=UPI000C2BE880|nr:IclR family transcriptional regulator [Microbacterium sp. BR1]
MTKAYTILGLFTPDAPTHELTSIQKATGLPFSTCSRIVHSLVAGGLLAPSPSGFRVGGAILRLARAAVEGIEPVDLIAPFVAELRDITGETTGFFVAEGANRVCVYVAEATHSLMRRLSIGHVLPLYVGSPGRVILAFSEEARRAVESVPRPTFTGSTKTDWADIERALTRVAYDGVAVSDGEWETGLSGVAAPVFSADGTLVGAIAVSAPTSRVNGQDLDRLCDTVRAAARQASLRLGYTG